MLELLQQLDTQFFYLINQTLSNPFFDFILPILREKTTWIPLYLLIIFISFKQFGLKKGLVLIAGMLLCIAFADGTANLFKNYFQRLRPCHKLLNINHLVHCGSGKSFISAHAANHFALATFWIHSFQLQKTKYFAILWAFSIAFSQVYVGVHYPFDIFVGGIIGYFLGKLIAKAIFRAIL